MAERRIFQPYEGFQEMFVSSNLDFVLGGGILGGGKTIAAVASVAEATEDPKFRGVFLRNNLGDLRSGGGILDSFREVYGDYARIVESGEPRVEFPSGCRIDVTHVADQSREKVLQRFKGRQYDYIYFDEMNGFTWECFTAIYTRNRGTAKWTGKVRGTTNPDRNSWIRVFIDWYIGPDGLIREDRQGVVRYFYINGESVKDVVWGDTKEEVYQKCKIQIDKKLRSVNGKYGKATYQDMIKSFTFYLGRLSENKSLMGDNSNYVGSVAVSGGRSAEQLLEGNWNVSPEENLDSPIPSHVAMEIFNNDPQRNGDKWITADLAYGGDDNFIALVWNGFHIIDYAILTKCSGAMIVDKLKFLASKHDISDTHIIYDATNAEGFMVDYLPDSIPFISAKKPCGRYARGAADLKTECYMRTVECIKHQRISFEDNVAYSIYTHDGMNIPITIMNEFCDECSVVRFVEHPSGKRKIANKKQMNQMLGRNRSMDLLDAINMRMYPVLDSEYGNELMDGYQEDNSNDDYEIGGGSIYDDSTWC